MMSPAEGDEELVEHLFEHLCEEQPEVVAGLPDAEILRRCQAGLGRARAHGIDVPEAITAFVALMFLVSPRFDEHPAIAAVLGDRTLPPAERMQQLFRRTREADWETAAALGGGSWPGAAD
jgi:hypothetical protein